MVEEVEEVIILVMVYLAQLIPVAVAVGDLDIIQTSKAVTAVPE
jgi:hypothetical protein